MVCGRRYSIRYVISRTAEKLLNRGCVLGITQYISSRGLGIFLPVGFITLQLDWSSKRTQQSLGIRLFIVPSQYVEDALQY